MTTPAIGLTTMHKTVPYMTVGMFKAEPTGLPPDSLVPGAPPQQQDAELARLIKRASQEMNTHCYGASGGTLNATLDTEVMRLPVDRTGVFRVTPRFTPVLALTAFSWGADPSAMSAVTDLTHVEIELTRIRVPAYPFTGISSKGPLQLGPPMPLGAPVLVQYSYANGWPLAQLASTASAGATSITVTDATGIYQGSTYLTIRDPVAGDESFIAGAVTGNTVACPPLTYTHTPQAGPSGAIQVDGMPEDFVTACTEITVGFLKRRAQETVRGSSKGKDVAPTSPGEDNFAMGFEALNDYVQVRTR